MTVEISDETLMLELARGNQAMLGTLYDRYAPAVYGVAMAIVREPSRAQDICQEAFVRSWTRADSFDSNRGSALNWLLGITRHLSVDELRRTRRDADRAERIGREHALEHGEPAETLLERDWQSHEIYSALAELSAVQRQTVELVYFEGHTLTEAAARLSVPPGTVKSRLNAALTRLRAVLARAEGREVEAESWCRP